VKVFGRNTLIFFVLLLAGCGTRRPRASGEAELVGQWYTVVAGDTVDAIARRYNVPQDDIVELNGLVDPDRLEVGQRLFLYGVEEVVRRLPKKAPDRPDAPAATPGSKDAPSIAWPMNAGVLSSGYGERWGRPHKGIDIAAEEGTPVYAAADGEVVFADASKGGYGNLVILKHSAGWMTIYGHNSRILVDEGDHVRQGAAIAEVGSTGRSTGPHLHFEIRIDSEAVDPMIHLPAR
jgi:murein DD-endopeptidase MepM/ murein hydrolase activator NlpD